MPLFQRNRNGRRSNISNVSHPDSSAADCFARQSEALIPAEVRMISGCHSEQTSADLLNASSVAQLPNPAGRAGGACTSALLEILYRKRNDEQLTFQQVLLDLRKSLANSGLDQIPQLTSSRPLELQETPFSLVGGNGTGIRRAVLVGINYRGQNGQLRGCHNDVFNVKQYIINEFGYNEQNIMILVDDGKHHYPNRGNIVMALRQLVAQSRSGDSVYFHYSGHGGLLNADWNAFKSGNKEYDETIYPLDHEQAGHIRDFSLFNHFVKPMARGVTATCVIDACHSGAVLELPYSYKATDGGIIRAQRNMSSLSNLAFLYLLGGSMLPHGFDNVAENIENVTGGNIEDYQGLGMDDAAQEVNDCAPEGEATHEDATDFQDADGYGDVGGPDYEDSGAPLIDDGAREFEGDQAGDFVGGSVQGYDVPDGGGDAYGLDEPYGADGGGDMLGWREEGDWGDVGDGGDPDMDCSCLSDVLGALLDGG